MNSIQDINLEVLQIFFQTLNITKSAIFFTSTLMIPIILVGLNMLWIYLCVRLFRNLYRTPSIDQCSQTQAKSVTNTFNQVNNVSLHSTENLPAVSIIIPARNEQENIARCLRSLLNQNYPNYDIIVVDDNSSDSTLKIMREIQNSIASENEKLIFQQHVQLQKSPQLVNQNSNILSTKLSV